MEQTRYHLQIVRCLFSLALLVGCPGPSAEPKKPPPNVPPDAPIAVVAGPSERDCTDQFAHAIEIYLADLRQQKPNQLPTADEITKLETELRDQYLDVCRAGSIEGHRCAMAATTLAQLGACRSS
jgi:hypothetical protein